MKKIIVQVKNNDSNKKDFKLFFGLINLQEPNLGVPSRVDIKVWIKTKNAGKSNLRPIKYSELLSVTTIDPIAVSVSKTTSNRQLEFDTIDPIGIIRPIVPQLTKEGKKILSDDYWEKNDWNIADTHKGFFLNGKEIIQIKLLSKQKFLIELDVIENVKSSNYFDKKS